MITLAVPASVFSSYVTVYSSGGTISPFSSFTTTVAVPIANDFIPEHRKGEGMGYYVMSTNLGVVFGPLLALTIIQFAV